MYLVWVPFQSEMKKLGAISDNKINLGAILVICRFFLDETNVHLTLAKLENDLVVAKQLRGILSDITCIKGKGNFF